jgi:toxin ParE1/3/4
MIRSVELLPLAWEGLLNIKHYVAEAFDEKTAEKVANAILDSLERLQSFPDSGSLTPDPWLNSLGYRMVISNRRNVSIYKRINETVYVYLIADTKTEYTRIFQDMIIHDSGLLLQEEGSAPDVCPGENDGRSRKLKEMYCEKCSRIIDADRCPFCKSRRVREPEAKDPCYLTEQDYISSGILEDLLKQNAIPYLKKDVMGAGMAIKVGPMLERSKFYVPFERLSDAVGVMDNLFSSADAAAGQSSDNNQ